MAEQTSRLYRSGLLDSMNVTAVYLASDNSSMPDFYDDRLSVEYGGDWTNYEWATLRRLEEYCEQEPAARVIYFHSKGASKSLDDDYGWNCYSWRKVMEHFTITLHRPILLKELGDDSPYMVAGSMKRSNHFSGE